MEDHLGIVFVMLLLCILLLETGKCVKLHPLKLLRRRFLLFIMQTKTYNWLLSKVIPFIRTTTYYPRFEGIHYHIAYDLMEPGDILLSIDEDKVTTALIGGIWPHAAVCVSKNNRFEVAEMDHTGYHKATLFDFCKVSSRIAILRCSDFDNEYTKTFIANVLSFEGATYDNQFYLDAQLPLGVKALYCSELVYQADIEHRMKVSLEDLAGLGRLYISPTGLANGKNMVCIYDSGPRV